MFVPRAYTPGEPALQAGNGHRGEMTEFEDTFADIGSMNDEELKALLLGKVSAVPEEETS
jgi:hypothetical protein